MDRNEKVGVSYPTFSIFTHLRAARSLRINSIRSNNSFPDGAECSRESKDCTVDVVLPAPRVNSRPPPLLTHRGVSSTVILACLLEPRAFPPSFPPPRHVRKDVARERTDSCSAFLAEWNNSDKSDYLLNETTDRIISSCSNGSIYSSEFSLSLLFLPNLENGIERRLS